MTPAEAAEALDAPVKAEVQSGLDSAKLLPVGHGYAELSAGVTDQWSGGLGAFVRGEVGWHPTQNLTAFAYAQADLVGVQAGLGAKVTF